MTRTLLLLAIAGALIAPAHAKPAAPGNYQSCTRTLTKTEQYRLAAEPNKSLWCDAVLEGPQLAKVLKICNVGQRCHIAGLFMGHGEFYWTKIIETHAAAASDVLVAEMDNGSGERSVHYQTSPDCQAFLSRFKRSLRGDQKIQLTFTDPPFSGYVLGAHCIRPDGTMIGVNGIEQSPPDEHVVKTIPFDESALEGDGPLGADPAERGEPTMHDAPSWLKKKHK